MSSLFSLSLFTQCVHSVETVLRAFTETQSMQEKPACNKLEHGQAQGEPIMLMLALGGWNHKDGDL